MTLFLVLITGSYVFLIGSLIYGWKKVPVFRVKNLEPFHKFSIIIPYRDEAENLPHLLSSFLKMKYPVTHFEILLVNDDSSDNSRKICADFKNDHSHFHISLLENKRHTNAPKKDAITAAVNRALYNHIITTDADCLLPPFWLNAFNDKLVETNASLVAGPVSSRLRKIKDGEVDDNSETTRLKRSHKYLYAFQELDLMSLQGAGVGAFGLGKPFIANGANLCYSREEFLKMNGFKGNEDITSGDDVFLLQKFKKGGLNTAFLKCPEAIVFTLPQPNIASLFSQRIRWAAKTPAYDSKFPKITGILVLLMNFTLVICAFLVIPEIIPYEPVLMAFLFKFLADLFLLYLAAKFYRRKEILRNYFWSSLVYPIFSLAVATIALFGKFEWKGRSATK